MFRFFKVGVMLLCCSTMQAQFTTDQEFEKWLHVKASPQLKQMLDNPDTFRYQLIYTQIDRDKNNSPLFQHFHLNANSHLYFNPASTVKMPLAFLALEKLNDLKKTGLNKFTPMLTDSGYNGQTSVPSDSSAANGLPSIAHYTKKVFLVSDNDAYNRLYEFIGQQAINERLWQMGYNDVRITRRFVRATEEENRHTNPIRFIDELGHVVYHQPAQYSTIKFDFSRKQLIGKAHYDRDEKLINSPMDFTTHNNAPLKDLQQMLQAVLFPEAVDTKQRFRLSEDDYRFLYQYMSELPGESSSPKYDTTEFFNSYTKFFMFRAGKKQPPPHIRIFNKTGWSYGFLTDVAYIVDFENKLEFMLSGNIYTNKDGVLNDDKYEYEETGYPFFQEIGNLLYEYELERQRKFKPDLQKFMMQYD